MQYILTEEEYEHLKNKADALDKVKEGGIYGYYATGFQGPEVQIGVYSGDDALSKLHDEVKKRDTVIANLQAENNRLYARAEKRWWFW